MTVICPHCGASNEADIVGHVTIACIGCGVDFETEVKDEQRKITIQPAPKSESEFEVSEPFDTAKDGLAVRCKICDRGELRLVKHYWLPKPLVILGYIVASPAVIYIFTAVVWLIAGGTSVVTAKSVSDATGFAIATGAFVSALILPALFFLLIGAIFVAKKRFLKCTNCQVTHPAD